MLIKRNLLQEIKKYLSDKEALIIVGARQVGKTCLLKLLMQQIADKSPSFYFDLEDLNTLKIFNGGVEEFILYLNSLGAPQDKKTFVFVDEFQYMENPSNFIKLLVDHYSERIKVIATGSSSLQIKDKFTDSMVGRKFVFTLYPLDFKEFLLFKGKEKLIDILPDEPFSPPQDIPNFFDKELESIASKFLITGGYPRLALETAAEKMVTILKEIVNTYVYKDIQGFFGEDVYKFHKVISIIASYAGGLLNVNEISSVSEISRGISYRYLKILEDSFIVHMLPPYSTTHRQEVTKTPKIYFLDNGIRNAIINTFTPLEIRPDKGYLLENAVLAGLLKHKKIMENVYYWRTKSKAEVDFILKKDPQDIIPIEVKCTGKTTRPLFSFMEKYDIKKGYVVSSEASKQQGNIRFTPFWWLL